MVKNFIKYTILFLVIVYSLEAILFFKFYLEKRYVYENDSKRYVNKPISFDTRHPNEVYLDLEKKNKKYSISICPSSFLEEQNQKYLFLSNSSHSKVVYCNDNDTGEYKIYKSDRYGFNNPDKDWEKDITFMLIGSVVAYGNCVKEEHTIAANLRKKISSTNGVLSLGQEGNSSLLNFATLREYFNLKKPKNVIWIFDENKNLRKTYEKEFSNKILIKYFYDETFSQNLISKQSIIDEHRKKFVKKMIYDFSLFGFFLNQIDWFVKVKRTRFFVEEFFDKNKLLVENISHEDLEASKFTLETIIKAKKYVEKNNSNFYLVYIPSILELENWNNNGELKDKYPLLKSKLYKNKINIIDINKEIYVNNIERKKLFGIKKHYINKEGLKLISNFIYKNL